MMPRLSIVLPCYNEAGTLPQIFGRFAEVIAMRTDLEVIFVNNGSQDNSAEVLAQELAKPGRPWAQQVVVPVNLGYGHGILAGLRAARGEFVGWTHADSQYDPLYVLEGFAQLLAAADPTGTLVQGRRLGRPLFDRLFTGGMTLVARAVLGVPVSDINAQPKLFPRTLLARMSDAPHDFSLDLYLLVLALRQGYRVKRLPVVFARREFGEAKGGAGSLSLKWKLTKRTWTFIWQLRRDLRAGRP